MRGGWSGGISAVAATEMALEQINGDQSLLKDYDLKLIWLDTAKVYIDNKLKFKGLVHILSFRQLDVMLICRPM